MVRICGCIIARTGKKDEGRELDGPIREQARSSGKEAWCRIGITMMSEEAHGAREKRRVAI